MNLEVVTTDPIARSLGTWSAGLTVGSILLRIFLSLLMGAFIGWERSSKRHSAGLRTFMLTFLVGTLAAIVDSYTFCASERDRQCNCRRFDHRCTFRILFFTESDQRAHYCCRPVGCCCDRHFPGYWLLYGRSGRFCSSFVYPTVVPTPGGRPQ